MDNRKNKNNIKAAIFDADGVLLDSLIPHLEFLRDMKVKYHCTDVKLPPNKNAREIVASPMRALIKKAGFPEPLIDDILKEYQEGFTKYKTPPYDGVKSMIYALNFSGYKKGIVTANTLANVNNSLGPMADHFGSIFTIDNSKDKTDGLKKCMEELQVKNDEAVYIGDQFHDFEAAKEVGILFIGTSYGWQIKDKNRKFRVVDTVYELSRCLTSLKD